MVFSSKLKPLFFLSRYLLDVILIFSLKYFRRETLTEFIRCVYGRERRVPPGELSSLQKKKNSYSQQMFSNSVWHIQSIEIEREIKIEKVWEVCIEGTQKGGGGGIDTMTIHKSKKELSNMQHRNEGTLYVNREEECACFYRIESQSGKRGKSETLKKEKNSFVKSPYSIWLFRLKQWRWQRVSAGSPVSQHARRARPVIGRSEHGSSSRFILQRHRFLSADCPS